MSEFDKTNSLVLGGQGTHTTVSAVKTKTNEGLESIFASQQTARMGGQSIAFIQPNNHPSREVFTSGGAYTDFSLPFNKERTVEINLVVAMASTSVIQSTPAHFFFDRVEYYAGSNLIAVLSGEFLYMKTNITYSSEQLTTIGRNVNMNSKMKVKVN